MSYDCVFGQLDSGRLEKTEISSPTVVLQHIVVNAETLQFGQVLNNCKNYYRALHTARISTSLFDIHYGIGICYQAEQKSEESTDTSIQISPNPNPSPSYVTASSSRTTAVYAHGLASSGRPPAKYGAEEEGSSSSGDCDCSCSCMCLGSVSASRV